MIFLEFDNVEVIDRIREKYDPLAGLVRPHITIVFPFELEMTDEELAEILDVRLKGITPFKIELQGFSKSEDTFGNYLMLNIVKGQEAIQRIHNELYTNEFACCNLGYKYVPHITVGKLENANDLLCAYEEVQKIDNKFRTIVNKVSVEMIGENEQSIIVFDKDLKNNRI